MDPSVLLDRMNKTGRLGGYVEQIFTGDSPGGAAVTIEVWKDAAGAKAYFDDYPHPAKDVQWQQITLPQQLGQQVFAYHYTLQSPSGTQAGYSLSWRNGRIILGVGELVTQGKEKLDKLMVLANILDQHATAAQQ